MIYLIGDTHFGHENIIKYCNRPFADIEDMEERLINNWNSIVNEGDDVYFLGDFVVGKNRQKKIEGIKKRLNGNIIFIKGNHDGKEFVIKFIGIRYQDYEFMLVHNAKSPYVKGFNGWVIHGHEHNNDLENYPFINYQENRINVSCELINYKPISMDFIISLIKKGKTIRSINDV